MIKKFTAVICLLIITAQLLSCSGTDGIGGGLSSVQGMPGVSSVPLTSNDNVVTTSPGTAGGTFVPNLAEPEIDESGVYVLTCAEDFLWLSDYVNGSELMTDTFSARLANDVDLSSIKNWTPIGADGSHMFKGVFDGCGFTVSGLKIGSKTESAGNYAALFGATLGGVIKNLNVRDFVIYGDTFAAAICASNGGIIENCEGDAKVYGLTNVGVICGFNSGTVYNCTSRGTVKGSENMIGGICGYLFNGKVEYCYNSANINGYIYVGGIVGYSEKGIIDNCTSWASVNAGFYVGGICGRSDSDNIYVYDEDILNLRNVSEENGEGGRITNCRNSGMVTASDTEAGGICGYSNAYIANCYNDAVIRAESLAAGIAAEAHNGAFYNVKNDGTVITGGGHAAGIVAITHAPVVLADNHGIVRSEMGRAAGIAVEIIENDIVSCLSSGSIKAVEMASGICCVAEGRIIGCASLSQITCESAADAYAILGALGIGDAEVKDCFYLKNSAHAATGNELDRSGCTQITDSDIYSGMLSYNLDKHVDDMTVCWGQDLTTDMNTMPELNSNGSKVFLVTKYSRCDMTGKTESVYSNTNKDIVPDHNFKNGKCSVCKITEDEFYGGQND